MLGSLTKEDLNNRLRHYNVFTPNLLQYVHIMKLFVKKKCWYYSTFHKCLRKDGSERNHNTLLAIIK